MVFSSTVFLFIFFPAVYILYTVVPTIKLKNVVLIIFSIMFYAFGEPFAVFLMLFSILLNYFFGLIIAKYEKLSKTFLVLSIVANLLMLCVFKYAGFLISTINSIAHTSIAEPNIRLPIGISFFTFQIMSYVIDVYKNKSLVQKNFFNLLLYISLFPQLIAGPVVKYSDIVNQLSNREVSVSKTSEGLRRFICGLSKKVLIANILAVTADKMFELNVSDMSILTCWLGGIVYTLQIYFDFSGYSDMAIGMGKMFGFTFKENFNYPFIAESMQDFWRRWHISISSWFKEYLYIPLGGNRKGKFRTAINKIIVFFCTGLWHGANVTFIVWGLVHGFFLLLESYEIIPIEKIKFKPLKHIYTMLVVVLTFVIFRAESISQALFFLKKMFTFGGISQTSLAVFFEQLTPLFIAIFIAGVVGSIPIVPEMKNKLVQRKTMYSVAEYSSYAVSLVLVFLCIISLASSSYNPFIYLQF